jgi:hypothetical protein
MKENVYTNQKLNTELLLRGAATYGSFERRLARLQRFIAYENKQMSSRQVLRKIILDEQEKVSQRGKLRASEYSAAWALMELRNYKTETRDSVEVPTLNESRVCICDQNLCCMQCNPGGYSNT